MAYINPLKEELSEIREVRNQLRPGKVVDAKITFTFFRTVDRREHIVIPRRYVSRVIATIDEIISGIEKEIEREQKSS